MSQRRRILLPLVFRENLDIGAHSLLSHDAGPFFVSDSAHGSILFDCGLFDSPEQIGSLPAGTYPFTRWVLGWAPRVGHRAHCTHKELL
jgi:hypothetical protein